MHPGEIVADRFEVLATAGSGGMGVVYRARDRHAGRDVALKLIVEREDKQTDRFAQEVELLSALEHPHIVGYVTHGTTPEGRPYLVMPWLEGMDLQERLKAGPLSIEETLTIAKCVADALGCLHARGLVHRDLKPSNLFLKDGKVENVQVIDLGIARATIPTRPMTMSGVLLGTPGFIAPEQAQGDREAAPAVDIFALGCVLFECLTGKRLFTGAHVMAVLAKILLQDPPHIQDLRPEAPDALDLLVRRMVAKDPERRPRDGAELRKWLDDLERMPASKRPPPNSLTAREQRVVSLLVVVLPSGKYSLRPGADATRVDANPLLTASSKFNVRVYALAERTALVLAAEGLTASDQASVLARFGRYVSDTFPGAAVALSTGSALTSDRQPVGEAIDRGVTMVREAKPGEGVHVDDVTAALITSRFDIKREGGRLIVMDERLSLDPTRPLLGKPTSCVGRERELAILDATYAECVERAGPRVVLVTAAPGAGKSRLRHEFVRRLRARDEPQPRVLQSRGDPLHVASPYAQLAQAVRQALDIREGEPCDAVLTKITAHVRERIDPMNSERVIDFLGELVGAPFDDDGHMPLRAARQNAAAMADQVRLAFEAIARSWCRESPVIVVLEDFHWGDDATVKLLDAALRKLNGEPLLVIALARPEVHERFPGLWKNRDVTELRLPPLPERAATKLIADVMGDRATPDVVSKIVARSEGNAFYLEELIRAADERARRTSTPPPSRRSELPPTVIAIAQSRLERLDPRVRKVLRAASVYGETFPLEGVSALVGEPTATLEPVFGELLENETFAPVEHPSREGVRELAFRHALLRGAAYATLTDDDRALGHRLAANWLESVDEDREVVALHWLEGGDRKRAAECFRVAAQTRCAHAQTDAATRCALRALLIADPLAENVEAITARAKLLADALETTRHVDAREVLSGIERHVAPIEPPSRSVAHVALERISSTLRNGARPVALSAFAARAACAVAALGDVESARQYLSLANEAAGDDEGARRMIGYAAANVAARAGEWGTVVDILTSMMLPEDPRERLQALVLLATGVVSTRGQSALGHGLGFLSRAESLLSLAEGGTPSSAVDDVSGRALCAKARVFCLWLARDHERAAKTAEDAAAFAGQLGMRFEECSQLHNLSELRIRLGALDQARISLASSNEIAIDIAAEQVVRHNRVLLAYLDGHADMLEYLADGSVLAKSGWEELYARYWLGRLLAERGDANARRELERALSLARELKVRMMADDCAEALAKLPGTNERSADEEPTSD